MYNLLIEDNDGFQTVVPIPPEGVTIGRQEGNTVRLPERNISREHARISLEDGVIYFEDVKARYGSIKNGRRITQKEKASVNDVFEIGDYTVRVAKVAGLDEKAEFEPAPTRVKSGSAPITDVARLVITSSNFAGREFALEYDGAIIGRDVDVDVFVEHRSVSARHAKITINGSIYEIIDLNSSNGTTVNGRAIDRHRLISGDIIGVGQVTFRFIGPGEHFMFILPEVNKGKISKRRRCATLFAIASTILVLLLAIGVYFYVEFEVEDPNPIDPQAAHLDQVINKLTREPTTQKGEVESLIDQAIGHFKELDMLGGIALLTEAKKDYKPTERQRGEIDKLLDAARLDVDAAKGTLQAEKEIESEEYVKALETMELVHSMKPSQTIKRYMVRHSFEDRLFAQLVKAANDLEPSVQTDVVDKMISINHESPYIEQFKKRAAKPPTAGSTPLTPEEIRQLNERAEELKRAFMRDIINPDTERMIERDCRKILNRMKVNDRCASLMYMIYKRRNKPACQWLFAHGTPNNSDRKHCN